LNQEIVDLLSNHIQKDPVLRSKLNNTEINEDILKLLDEDVLDVNEMQHLSQE